MGSDGGASAPQRTACRLCGAGLETVFADLGMSPLANAFLTADQVNSMEPFYPLRAMVCDECLLVQVQEFQPPSSIFSDYAYFSSFSTEWLAHSERFAQHAAERFGLTADSRVVEVASNDGYLLQYFVARGIPCVGIEPARNVAQVALDRGIPTRVDFFGRRCAREELDDGGPADVIVANNVLPHTPALTDFVGGLKLLLAPGGTISCEFPYLLELIERAAFDTIYHEHFSYISFGAASRIFAAHGLRLWDVEELPTHGGSLRILAVHEEDGGAPSEACRALLKRETGAGLDRADSYRSFAHRTRAAKRQIVSFLLGLKEQGLRLAAYGAPAKGNTLLNYCGLGPDVIDFTVDRNPRKQGTFLPGTHIPVLAPEAIDEARPDVVVILPWNLRDEVAGQLEHIRSWGGRFAARTPEMALLP